MKMPNIPSSIFVRKEKSKAEAIGALMQFLGAAIESGELNVDSMHYSAPGSASNQKYKKQWHINIRGEADLPEPEPIVEESFTGQLF